MNTSSDNKMLSRRHLIASAAAGLALACATAAPAIAGAGGPGEAPQAAAQSKWVVMAGSSLKDTLDGWCRVAGWTLLWDSPVDYRMRASATFNGPFEDSAARLIDSIYANNPELMAIFHRGNRILQIKNQPLSSN